MSWCGNCPEGAAIPHGATLAATPHSFCKQKESVKEADPLASFFFSF